MKKCSTVLAILVVVSMLAALAPMAMAQGPVKATPGQAVKMVLLPKFLGNLVFDQAHQGALEAAAELQNPEPLQFLGPTPQDSVAGQIEIVTNSTTQGMDAIMLSNNAGDQIVPAAKAAREAGVTFVTWDSPIPSAEGEQLFVAQVDFDETGKVMADMALNILGADGGKFAVLSASPDAANQNAWIAALKEVLKQPRVRQVGAAGHRVRQRRLGGQLQPGTGAGGQVPRYEADHGADLDRHRGGRQGAPG
jgi:rhamnose transport system substrate-binding protein